MVTGGPRQPGREPLGRPFWLAWSAGTVSTLGDGIRYVAFPLLTAELTRDPRAVTAVAAAGYLPWLLFGLVGGAVVDRVDRRVLMWRTDVVRALVVAGFTALVAAQQTSVLLIAAMTFVLGTAQVLFDNADSALLPMIVPSAALERANSLLVTSQTLMSTLIGAPVGGLLYALAPALPPLADAVTFGLAALLVLAIPGSFSARTGPGGTTVWQEIGTGLRWLWRDRVLRTLTLLLGLSGLTFAAAEAVLVLYALEVLKGGTLTFTVLLMAFAVGGLAGSLVTSRLRLLLGLRPLVLGAALLQAAGIGWVGVVSSLPAALPALVLVGACNLVWNVAVMSERQRRVPAELLGRVTSAYRMVGIGSNPVGALLGGAVARGWGLHAPYLYGSLLMVVVTLACAPALADPTPTAPAGPRDPAGPAR